MGTKGPGSGTRGGFAAGLARVRAAKGAIPVVLGVAALAAGAVFVGSLIGGDGGKKAAKPGKPGLASIAATRSSWVPGQASLVSYEEYGDIAGRAEELGELLLKDRAALLRAIEQARLRAERRAQRRAERRARRQYLRERRQARREYRRELREAARERRRAEREAKRECLQAVREAARQRRENAIEPGEECKIPGIREHFDCEKGFVGPRPTAAGCA